MKNVQETIAKPAANAGSSAAPFPATPARRSLRKAAKGAEAKAAEPKAAAPKAAEPKADAKAAPDAGKSIEAFAAAVRADAAQAATKQEPVKGGKGAAKGAQAKPDAKAKPVKAKAEEKAGVKAEVKAAPFVPRAYQKGQTLYTLDENSRPQNGRFLLAHTHAALTVLGLMQASRPAIRKNQLLTLVGQRAVTYHTKLGNLEAAPDNGIRLSILGYNTFTARMREGRVDVAAATAFQSAFLDGTVEPKYGIGKASLYGIVFN